MAELIGGSASLAGEAAVELEEINAESHQAAIRGKTDINFFASLALPTVMVSPLPYFYVMIFQLLSNRTPEQMGRILRFALGLPRGHAKTTFIKVLICWFIVYDKVSFVAIICATEPMAANLLSDVNDILGSPNMEAVYGNWDAQLTTDQKEQKQAFYHGRSVILIAKGAGSAIRGLNINNKRPDLIFCDDAQTKECDDSPTERIKFRKWLLAMFKIISPKKDRLIIYVGNMYSDECLLYQFKMNPSWVSLITGAITANGEPLWPELHSLEELAESYLHDSKMGEADVWFAEVMNDPISRATSLLHSVIPSHPFNEETLVPDAVFLTIDPAGFREISDDNVIACHYVIDGKGAVADLDVGIKDPEALIKSAILMALHHGASLIGIEDTAYQQTLLFWISKYIDKLGLHGIVVVPLKHKGRSKESRIRLFVSELFAENYYLLDKARAQYEYQAMAYKVGKKDNRDDILDAVAYGLDVRAEHWYNLKNLLTDGQQMTQAVGVQDDNTSF